MITSPSEKTPCDDRQPSAAGCKSKSNSQWEWDKARLSQQKPGSARGFSSRENTRGLHLKCQWGSININSRKKMYFLSHPAIPRKKTPASCNISSGTEEAKRNQSNNFPWKEKVKHVLKLLNAIGTRIASNTLMNFTVLLLLQLTWMLPSFHALSYEEASLTSLRKITFSESKSQGHLLSLWSSLANPFSQKSAWHTLHS